MWHLGLKKDPKVIVLAVVFVALSVLATVLAISYHFFPPSQSPDFYSSVSVYSE